MSQVMHGQADIGSMKKTANQTVNIESFTFIYYNVYLLLYYFLTYYMKLIVFVFCARKQWHN